jgi:hypothetical protein
MVKFQIHSAPWQERETSRTFGQTVSVPESHAIAAQLVSKLCFCTKGSVPIAGFATNILLIKFLPVIKM